MKNNKKGFTLIELLAVIIILGVLLLLAVPSVTKYIERGRLSTYKSSISSMVSVVSNEVNMMEDDNYKFSSTEYLVVPFVCIDLERGNNTKSPFNTYNVENSMVIVTRNANNGYNYYISAKDANGYGVAFTEQSNFTTVSALADTDNVITIEANDDTATSATYPYKTNVTGTGFTGKNGKVVACTAFTTAFGE